MKTPVVCAVIALSLLFGCFPTARTFRAGKVSNVPAYGEIPFELTQGLMIVRVNMGGQAWNFLFDTGAPMVVTPELSQALALKNITKGKVTDSQGSSQQLPFVRLPRLEMGGISQQGLAAIVADLKLSPEIGCLQIDGILGANFMRRVAWSIDFDRGRLVTAATAADLVYDEAPLAIIPFKPKASFTPVVSLEINGETFHGITFDTGYAGALNLQWDRAESIRDPASPYTVGYHSAGIFGAVFDTAFYQRVQVSGLDTAFERVPLIMEKNHGNNLIGLRLLERFRVVLDWSGKEILLYPGPEKPASPHFSFGFTPRLRNDTLVVGSILAGSAAEAAGMEVGDPIQHIRSIPGAPIQPQDYCKVLNWFRGINSDTISLRLLNGDSLSLEKSILFK